MNEIKKQIGATIMRALLWALGLCVRVAICVGFFRLMSAVKPPAGESLFDKAVTDATVGDIAFSFIIVVIVSTAFYSIIMGRE